MKLLYPRLSALKRAFIMCLVFVAGANTSEFEIGVYPTYMDDIKTNISFNGDMLVRFRDCLCNKLTIKCNADLNCSNEACQVSNISSIAQKGFRVNRQYHCFLGLKTKGVFCRRLSTPPNSHWNAVFYTSYASECQLNCVQIYWNRTQFVDINCSFTDIILSGNAPSTCNVTTTSTTQTTPTPTTTVLTAATTIKQQTSVSATSKEDPFTTTLKTNLINGDSGDSGGKMPVILGVTISLFALLAFGVGLFLLWRWRQKHDPQTRLNSQKPTSTVSAESKSDNVTKNEISTYSNINSDDQGNSIDALEAHNTPYAEIIDQDTVVYYSNSEVHHSEQPVFPIPGPKQLDSNVYFNNAQIQNGVNGFTLINRIGDVKEADYSLIDRNPNESPYSNTELNSADISKSDRSETYLNFSKRQTPFLCENGSTIYYELESTTINPDSEKQPIEETGGTSDTSAVNNVYSKLRDQIRHFNNPYNAASSTVDSVTMSNLELPDVI